MPPHSIVNAASSEFKVGISWMKAYRPKAEALQIIEGTVADQYGKFWDYCNELEDKNPGSTTKMQCEFVDGVPVFKRLYICLEPLKRGFRMNCMPFIGLNACHLTRVYGGQLIITVGIDPNNETWVLAYVVVKMETRESRTWFIDLLAKDLGIVNSHGWAFISDEQKGRSGAFEDIVPNAETKFCVMHLRDNFNKTDKGKVLRDQLWTCARATNVPSFQYQMEVMKTLDSNAWAWLAEKQPTQWSKSHFSTLIKCDMLQNNLCESFNSTIKTARDKLEMIRCLLMRKIQWRRDKMSSWPHQICKNIFHHVQ